MSTEVVKLKKKKVYKKVFRIVKMLKNSARIKKITKKIA